MGVLLIQQTHVLYGGYKMNKEDAEKIVKDLNNCSLLVYYVATPRSVDPINVKVSVLQADIAFDDGGFYIRDKMNEGTEIRVRYVNLVDDIKLARWSTKILTYTYETIEIKIEF